MIWIGLVRWTVVGFRATIKRAPHTSNFLFAYNTYYLYYYATTVTTMPGK